MIFQSQHDHVKIIYNNLGFGTINVYWASAPYSTGYLHLMNIISWLNNTNPMTMYVT